MARPRPTGRRIERRQSKHRGDDASSGLIYLPGLLPNKLNFSTLHRVLAKARKWREQFRWLSFGNSSKPLSCRNRTRPGTFRRFEPIRFIVPNLIADAARSASLQKEGSVSSTAKKL
jgi:hypothetical protein